MQVSEGIHTFDLPRPRNPPAGAPSTREPIGVHVFDGEQTVLIGTGFSSSTEELVHYLDEFGGVDVVVVEHGDQDHFEAAPELIEAYEDAELAIPEEDAHVLDDLGVEPDVLLSHDEERWGLRVIHVPGHTPGNMSFLHEATGTLFVGDTFVHASSFSASDEDWSGSLALMRAQSNVDDVAARENVIILDEYDFEIALTTHGHNVTYRAGEAFDTMLQDAGFR